MLATRSEFWEEGKKFGAWNSGPVPQSPRHQLTHPVTSSHESLGTGLMKKEQLKKEKIKRMRMKSSLLNMNVQLVWTINLPAAIHRTTETLSGQQRGDKLVLDLFF